ncbi:hypothetical protein [Halofilum ochraceum]|uniref:hypothetical protein n=1 Tax=Halofilum ochraceum TaxID=1611323 RepID=UPI001113222E|nr:hypothetical protein [Halofilum ochraceum]
MKRLWVVLMALWATTASAEVVDIKIYDAFGQSYQSVNIGARLASIYNISFDPTMVIILGPTLADERVQQQEKIAAGIDPEEHGILFAIGTPSETYSRGFSLAPNTAASLMPDPESFRVLVLGANGTVLSRSGSVMSRERLVSIADRQQ